MAGYHIQRPSLHDGQIARLKLTTEIGDNSDCAGAFKDAVEVEYTKMMKHPEYTHVVCK